ncbi:MAG: hypothetical protein ABIH52_02200 [Candidatus Aenigmatarchaeota archaeon]
MTSVENLIETISKESKQSVDEIKTMIEEKQLELSGLISEEGAAYIIGRELGVSLLKETNKDLKIKNIVTGLKSVDVTAKVMKINEPREFDKKGKKGLVQNILLADDTGRIRLTLWNEETDIVKESKVKEEDVIKITGAYVRADNLGNPNVMIGRGKIEKVDDDIEVTNETFPDFGKRDVKTAPISKLKVGDYQQLRACLVQLFSRTPYYEVCTTCGKRVAAEGENWVCAEHGNVEPDYRLVLSGIIDDGFGNIRVVFFGETAEKLIGKKAGEVAKLKDSLSIYEDVASLGKEFIFTGAVKQNSFTERNEMVVNDLRDVDVKAEIQNIIKDLKDENKN